MTETDNVKFWRTAYDKATNHWDDMSFEERTQMIVKHGICTVYDIAILPSRFMDKKHTKLIVGAWITETNYKG